MKTTRFNFQHKGFALLEVTIVLILTAGLTLYFLYQLKQQAAMDKVAAFADEYVTVHKAAERYINKYKVALQKTTGSCQTGRLLNPLYISLYHVDISPSHGSTDTSTSQDCRLRDPVTMQLVVGSNSATIDNAFNLSVEDLIHLGLLPASMSQSGRVLPSLNTTVERDCPASLKDSYDPSYCTADTRPTTPGPFLQIQMLCNGLPVIQAERVVTTDRVTTLCTGDLLFRTVVYSKQPLPKFLPSLNLTRNEVLLKAAQTMGSNAVMSLDNALAPENGTDGLLYNAARTLSIDNPVLFEFRLVSEPVSAFVMRTVEGIFAIYGDYPQPNAVKQTPFASCNPGIDLVAFPNAIASKTVGTRKITADLTNSVMVCGTTSVTGFCSASQERTCWIPLEKLPADNSKGRDTPGYPLGYYDFFFPADDQEHTYP